MRLPITPNTAPSWCFLSACSGLSISLCLSEEDVGETEEGREGIKKGEMER